MYDAVDDWLSLNDGSFVGAVFIAIRICFYFSIRYSVVGKIVCARCARSFGEGRGMKAKCNYLITLNWCRCRWTATADDGRMDCVNSFGWKCGGGAAVALRTSVPSPRPNQSLAVDECSAICSLMAFSVFALSMMMTTWTLVLWNWCGFDETAKQRNRIQFSFSVTKGTENNNKNVLLKIGENRKHFMCCRLCFYALWR